MRLAKVDIKNVACVFPILPQQRTCRNRFPFSLLFFPCCCYTTYHIHFSPTTWVWLSLNSLGFYKDVNRLTLHWAPPWYKSSRPSQQKCKFESVFDKLAIIAFNFVIVFVDIHLHFKCWCRLEQFPNKFLWESAPNFAKKPFTQKMWASYIILTIKYISILSVVVYSIPTVFSLSDSYYPPLVNYEEKKGLSLA